jgi:hypothetical protein
LTVNTKEVASSSQICFRFKDTAEPLLQYVIPASNFQVYIITNAECENCNLYTDLGIIQAQNTDNVCRNIKVPKNLSTLSMNVAANWQALSIKQVTYANYICPKVGEERDQIKYFCRLSS